MKLVSRLWRWLPPAFLLGAGALVVAGTPGPDYAIVVSRATQADRDWRRVVEVLREKHRGAVIVFDVSVEEAQPKLRALFPRYACFVARPGEVSRRVPDFLQTSRYLRIFGLSTSSPASVWVRREPSLAASRG